MRRRPFLRRLRRSAPVAPSPVAAGPIYRTASGRDVIGCRLCLALRELLTFNWSSDPRRMNQLMDDGGCYPTLPGLAYERIEAGEEFSMFRRVLDRPGSPGLLEPPGLWFRNADMVVEGSNQAERGG